MTVSTQSGHTESVTATHGHDGDAWQGGDGNGYSGGGQCCGPFKGGFNGGDGEDDDQDEYEPGHGTGEDILAYKMENFVLTPGAGGNYYDYEQYEHWGGGGGGVLINGDGPMRDSDYQGEGYGGGGCGHRSNGSKWEWIETGLQGVNLLEVVTPKKN